MAYLSIVQWDDAGRVMKYQAFSSRREAVAHGDVVVGSDGATVDDVWPDRIVARAPKAPHDHWLVDPIKRTVGVLPPEVSVADIKAEAGRRIVALYPEWKQRNMIARALELSELKRDRALTDSETSEEIAIRAAWVEIGHIRAASDRIESMSPRPFDYDRDDYWREVES